MEDRQLGDLLRELSREHARPGFTARVLQELGSPGERAPWQGFRMALAGALAAAAALAISVGVPPERPRSAIGTAEARQILEELRAEHGRLERELQALSEPPVVYGSDEDVDLVLDLRQVYDAEGVAPAAYTSQTY